MYFIYWVICVVFFSDVNVFLLFDRSVTSARWCFSVLFASWIEFVFIICLITLRNAFKMSAEKLQKLIYWERMKISRGSVTVLWTLLHLKASTLGEIAFICGVRWIVGLIWWIVGSQAWFSCLLCNVALHYERLWCLGPVSVKHYAQTHLYFNI